MRVAEEALRAQKSHQIGVVKSYLEAVATFIDAAHPHTMRLWNNFGMSADWREAKNVQNDMCLIVQYLDEVHHGIETGDLRSALSLNLLSFQ